MTIDSRAYAWCNLGPLAPGGGSSVAETHVQGSGVITCRGTINLSGVYRPAPGAVVELAYSDGQNWLARLPVRLRVLSSFANPLGGKTTSVSVGCDLAYFEDRKQPPKRYTARQANPGMKDVVFRWVTPSISANWLAGQILADLGITAANGIPLTNFYILDEFDMSAGYVEELGKLAQSECYAVRMNPLGLLEFIHKNPPGIGTSGLIGESDIIDLNSINTGDLPGETVEVDYRSKKLKAPESEETWYLDEAGVGQQVGPEQVPFIGSSSTAGSLAGEPMNGTLVLQGPPTTTTSDPTDPQPPGDFRLIPATPAPAGPNEMKRNWEKEEVQGKKEIYTHNYTLYVNQPTGAFRHKKNEQGWKLFQPSGSGISDIPILEPVYETKAAQFTEKVTYFKNTTITTTYDSSDRVKQRVTKTRGVWAEEISTTDFEYSGDQIRREKTVEYSAIAPVMAACGYQLPFRILARGIFNGVIYLSSLREVEYEKNELTGITKTTTSTADAYYTTPEGSEVVSRLRKEVDERVFDATNQARFAAIVAQAIQLVGTGVEVRIRTERNFGIQRRPPEIDRVAEYSYKLPPQDQKEELSLQASSVPTETSRTLSPPYAPDDRVEVTVKVTTDANGIQRYKTEYKVIRSDADQKALAYAAAENRLLLGHRNGAGIQVLPEVLPPTPMGLVYIRLNGCTGAYRINGTTWNIDPAGVTATTDALFWGAIDGTAADAWFPLPPGVNSLPGLSAVTTNASPRPANAINIPNGFSFTDPNLNSLFSSLPTATAPTYAKTITPGVLLKPYHETISISAGSGSGLIVTTQPWIPQVVQLLAGSGSGAVVDLRQTLVGSLSGALVTTAALSRSIAWASDASSFTPGARQVLTPSMTGVQWVSGASTFTPGLRSSQGGSVLTVSNTAAITMPESGAPTPYPSTITVSDGLGLLVDKLTVSISGFSHTYVGDVGILLVSPTGARSVLMVGVGDGVSSSGLNITFDQSAASVVTGATSGTFRPGLEYSGPFPEPAPALASDANLANFANAQVFGTWSLYVKDSFSPDSGSISGGWSMQINYKPDTTAVTNPGAAWISGATTFTPGAAVVLTAADTGAAWVSGASTFAPGARSSGRTDASFAQVQLLVHGDGINNATTFTDASGAARTLTANGNIKISTDQGKFGGSSIYCDGTGDFLSFTAISIGTSDNCTLEAWIYPTSTADRAIFGHSNSAVNMQPFSLLSGRLSVYWAGTQLDGSTVTANTWTHVALTRSGGILRLFQNGTLTATSGSNTAAVALDRLGRGQYRGDFIGWIDDARVTVGTARYTASFTAPDLPFPDE